jgi:EpsI family protein
MIKFVAAVLILGLNSYVYWYLASEEVIPPRTEFSNLSNEIDGWRCIEREKMDDDVLENLMVTDYIACSYYNAEDKQVVHLYVGYHERQTRDRSTGKATAIHPPEHCLPGSGWDVIDSSIVPIDADPGGEAKRFIIAKGNQRSLVYFWYHSRGRVIARNHEKILYMFLDRARYGRTDGSLVRFTIPIANGDVEAAEATFDKFSRSVTPAFARYIPD